MLVDLDALTKDFGTYIDREIVRIKGGHRHVWNDCGTFTKLLMNEVVPLAYRFAGQFVTLDPAHAMEYLAAYPEALAKTTSTNEDLARVIVDTVQSVIADRLATATEIRKIVLDQWAEVTLADLMAFTDDYMAKVRAATQRAVSPYAPVEDIKGLEELGTYLGELGYYFPESDDPIWADLERRNNGYLEFILLVCSGELEFEALKMQRETALII